MATMSRFEWNAVAIKALRKHMDLSRQEMSEWLGTDEKTLGEWESGQSEPGTSAHVQLNVVANRVGFPYGVRIEETPLDVLDLPSKVYMPLKRGGYTTVEQVAALSDEEFFSVPRLGWRALIDVSARLTSYLPRYPLPATHQKSKQVVRLGRPLEVLSLSNRPRNCLLRAGYRTVGQVARLSDEELLVVRNLGWKSLEEIKAKLAAYLRDHPVEADAEHADEDSKPFTEPPVETCKLLPPPPLATWEVLDTVRERSIPLDAISVERLELPTPSQDVLEREGIDTIGALASQPEYRWVESSAIRERLNRYLTWIIDQDERIWTEEVTGKGISPFLRMTLADMALDQLVQNWFADLVSREQQVIQWRYGLCGDALTLEEIGEEHLGVTRERVRQIQKKATNKLSSHLRRQQIQPFVELLKNLLRDAGGLMNEDQIEAALTRELAIGDIQPAGVVRLIGAVYTDFKWLRKTETWGLTDYPLNEVDGIQKRLVRVLEKKYVPLSVNEVIETFKASRFYRGREDTLDDHFIEACLRVHPGVLIDEDGLCSLKKWERRSTDEIILALRETGEPAHYSEIATETNRLLDPEMRTSAHNIHAILLRRTDLFVRVGHGIFGLKEWGLPDDGSLANAAYRVLTEVGHPLHIEAIADLVLETWHAGRASVHTAIINDDRFYRAAPATFGLLEWEIERLDEEQPVLNICPPPLPDRRGERNTFFESVLVAHDLLRERPTTSAFLRAMLRWVGTDEDKSERYLQNVLNAYYVVGLVPYTVYRRAADVPLHSTLPDTGDLQDLRRFCLGCMLERLGRMAEFVTLLAVRQPCTRAELCDLFHGPNAPLDDVKNRVRLLTNLGMLQPVSRGQYCLTPLGGQITEELEAPDHWKGYTSHDSRKQLRDGQSAWDTEFDVIDFEFS